MLIPCENCITLAVCKFEVLEKHRNDEFATASLLYQKCKIFKEVLHEIINTDIDDYEIFVMSVLSFFRGLESNEKNIQQN